jgi:hypothetical protein
MFIPLFCFIGTVALAFISGFAMCAGIQVRRNARYQVEQRYRDDYREMYRDPCEVSRTWAKQDRFN